jgi:hypothetical protein
MHAECHEKKKLEKQIVTEKLGGFPIKSVKKHNRRQPLQTLDKKTCTEE